MHKFQWNSRKIEQLEYETGQALLKDEPTLVSFSQDFGKLFHSRPAAVCMPKHLEALQALISFAKQHKLPVTIRGNGLSQGGQSLPVAGGLTLSMRHFSHPLDLQDDAIWVEANTSWSDLLRVTLPQKKAPYVLPYNCNLSVAGILSVGGVGAASFKYGTISAYVSALEVIDASGMKQVVEKSSPLFHACLSGQGQFAVITKACIQLRSVKSQVKTVFLVYADHHQWFADIDKIKDKVDYLELFCSPSLQGAKLIKEKRVPMAQWLYGLHLSIEYEGAAPDVKDIIAQLKPMNVLHSHEETISSYFLRHNSRFELMKMSGQWDLIHPWYECFVPTRFLQQNLAELLKDLPIHYANLVHVVPIAKHKAGLLMLPDSDSVCSLMILNPGVPDLLKDSCLQVIKDLDSHLLRLGGKRYLSGFLGSDLAENYWKKHYGAQYQSWLDLKKHCDPEGIFSSFLYG